MGVVKRQFTEREMESERILVKAIFGCEIDEMPDTPESELIRMEVEADLRRESVFGSD